MELTSIQRTPSSSCVSSSIPRWTYDVFLSFHNKDTGKSFADHLYAALKQRKISFFRNDEKLEDENSASEELPKAIQQSQFAVVVISEHYASSKSCLIELIKIVECKRERGLTILPVFYRVDPSEVRKQTGSFGEAFTIYKRDHVVDEEQITSWRAAFEEVGSLVGWQIHDRNVATVVEEIFTRVEVGLSRNASNTSQRIDAVEDIEDSRIFFPGSIQLQYSYLEQLWDGRKSHLRNMKSLRLFGRSSLEIPDHFGCSRLEMLPTNFCYSNLTTRNSLEVLNLSFCITPKIPNISPWLSLDLSAFSNLQLLDLSRCSCLNMLPYLFCCSSLTTLKALNLSVCLSLRALDLSVCSQCSLSLQILCLFGCSTLEILDLSSCSSLKRLNLSNCSSLKILNFPKCSSLQKLNLFNCSSLELLNLSNNSSLKELNLFGNSSLEELNLYGCSSLEELNLYGCSSLEELNLYGCSSLKELNLYGNSSLKELNLSGCSSLKELKRSNCSSLEILDISGCSSLKKLSLSGCSSLKELNLSGCSSLKKLSLSGCSSLKELNLSGCSSLKELYLLGCSSLKELNLSGCSSLKELKLFGSSSLKELKELILSCCSSLKELQLSGCPSLMILDISDCSSLRGLDLSSCSNVTKLNLSNCSSLERLAPSCTSLKILNHFGCSSLMTLDMCHCTSLEILKLADLSSIKTLSLLNCPGLEQSAFRSLDFSDLADFPNLERLVIRCCGSLEILDLTDYSILQSLELDRCWVLKRLNLHGCSSLNDLKFVTDSRVDHPENDRVWKLETLDLSGCARLENLSLSKCSNLKTLDLSGCSSVKDLDLSGCFKLETLLNLSSCSSLQTLDIASWSSLKRLNLDDAYSSLKKLKFFECLSLEILNLCGCPSLEILDISSCSNLQNLKFFRCSSLNILNLSGCSSLEILDLAGCSSLKILYLSGCSRLETLELSGCSRLEILNLSLSLSLKARKLSAYPSVKRILIGHYSNLRTLNPDYSRLDTLNPDLKFFDYRSLQHSYFRGSEVFEELENHDIIRDPSVNPRGSSLKVLNLSCCSSLKILDFSDCLSLKSLDLSGCSSLEALLNFSKCTSLKTLDISRLTQITGNSSDERLLQPQGSEKKEPLFLQWPGRGYGKTPSIVPKQKSEKGKEMTAYEIAPFPPDSIFRPTDEQLGNHYLRLKNEGHHSEIQIIPVIDFFNYDPEDLPAFSATNSENSHWFFCSRHDAPYWMTTGLRSITSSKAGFWMTTGFRFITSSKGVISGKWISVFYKGVAPYGDRTKWMLHEYHTIKENNSPREHDFILCHLTEKEGYQDGDGIIDDVNVYLRHSTASSVGLWAEPFGLVPARQSVHRLLQQKEYFAKISGVEAIEKSETQGELLEIEAVDVKLKSGEVIEESREECETSQSCPTQSSLELNKPPKHVDWEKDEEICLTDGELPKNPRSRRLLTLSLQGNKRVRKIPESFFYCMPELQILDLSSTGIRSLPDSIKELVSLKRLHLKDCHYFMELKPNIGALNRLEVLDLEGTDIIELPEEIKKLTNLKCLKVSLYSFPDDSRSDMQSNVRVHCGVISKLSNLNKLSIRVNPNDKWWIACVESIVSEVCSLESLDSLEFYFPTVELVSQLLEKWKSPSLSDFRFTVGRHVRRTLSRLPCDADYELERQARCLKFINGEDLPKDIRRVLQRSTAFFLERHATIRKISEFGIENMEQLKCCVVGQCNKVEVIIDEANTHKKDGEVVAAKEDENTHGPKRVVFESLEYLYIYYMMNLISIWKAPIQPQCLSCLKILGVRTCPQLTTIFTEGLLGNLEKLEEITLYSCPSVMSLVNHETSIDNQASYVLQNLKKILLHDMPGLVTISSVPLITPNLELMSFYNCPNLKRLCIEEKSRKALREIKGEKSWWEALEWRHGCPSYLDDIFVPINGLDIECLRFSYM